MRRKFHVGETVICSIDITGQDKQPVDPATSIKITIKGPATNGVENQDMVKDDVGKYHYDFNPSKKLEGTYTVIYTDVDGTRVTIADDHFEYIN